MEGITLTPEQQLAAQTERIAEQDKKIEQLTALVSQAINPKAATKKVEYPSVPKDHLKIGKKKYKWNVAVFKMPGSSEKITAEEAATDEKVLAAILEIEGQGILSEVV